MATSSGISSKSGAAEIEVVGAGIIRISGQHSTPAPRLGLVSNIHGDEIVGREVARRFTRDIRPVKGVVYLIDANPEACLVRKRFIDRDMNRLFKDELVVGKHADHETARASYLMKTIKSLKLDYVLDYHSTSSEIGSPFILCWPGSETLGRLVSIRRTYGWSGIVEGTLVEYLSSSGIPAIALEAGQHARGESESIAVSVTREILQRLEMLPGPVDPAFKDLGHADYVVLKREPVREKRGYRYTGGTAPPSFQPLAPGELIAKDDAGNDYIAPVEQGLSILMPAEEESVRQGINADAYFLIQKQ